MTHMHQENEEEDDVEKPWDPEEETIEKEYMKLAKKFMKEQLDHLQSQKEAAQRPKPAQSPMAMGLGMLVAGIGQTPGVMIRRIENGFLMTYNEVKETSVGLGNALPLPAGAPPGMAQALAALPHVHKVEVFVKDAAEALPHLQTAMASMEKMSKMNHGGFFA